MAPWENRPQNLREGNFAARLRLCLMPTDSAPVGQPGEDDVLAATRRLHAARRAMEEGGGRALADSSDSTYLGSDLAHMDRRLNILLQRLGGPPPEAARKASPNLGTESATGDAVALALLQRGRGYFDEWRLLLLDEEQPATQLLDFAASPYVDMLERHHPRLALLVDGEGRLLRLLNGARLEESQQQPVPGARLDPLPNAEHVQVAWQGLPPLRWTPLGSGMLLVREELEASSPLPQPLR